MPAQIIKVKDKREISDLFVVINKTGRRSLKPNEVFVHEVLSGVPHATNTATHLQTCGLTVSLGTGLPNSVVGALKGPEVQIKGFQKSIKDNTIKATEAASKVIISTWTQSNVLPRNVSPELLRGLARAYSSTPRLNRTTKKRDLPSTLYNLHAKQFEDFIKQTAKLYPSQKDMSSMFKVAGGKVGNHDDECIALGALRLFKGFVTNPNYAHKFTSKTFNKYYSDCIQELESKIS